MTLYRHDPRGQMRERDRESPKVRSSGREIPHAEIKGQCATIPSDITGARLEESLALGGEEQSAADASQVERDGAENVVEQVELTRSCGSGGFPRSFLTYRPAVCLTRVPS